MDRRLFTAGAVSILGLALGARPALAAKPPAEWDGLVRVKSKRMDYIYLLPGADFREYTKVMLDPTEVAFQKNWLRDFNNTTRSLEGRVSEKDVQEAITRGAEVANEILVEAFTEGGYPVVKEGGADVLRLRTGVINISVAAPDRMVAGRSRTYSEEAGGAQLVVEARDSVSGTLLGRAVDGQVIGDNSMFIRNSVTNRADFRNAMKRWAKMSVDGLGELKAQSPIGASGVSQAAK